VIPKGAETLVGATISVTAWVARLSVPIRFVFASVNQTLPSGPRVMSVSPALDEVRIGYSALTSSGSGRTRRSCCGRFEEVDQAVGCGHDRPGARVRRGDGVLADGAMQFRVVDADVVEKRAVGAGPRDGHVEVGVRPHAGRDPCGALIERAERELGDTRREQATPFQGFDQRPAAPPSPLPRPPPRVRPTSRPSAAERSR